MKKLKFSIITCTYNSAEYLPVNIDSLINQTYHNYEHIFVDGYSSDNTIEIIGKYKTKFPDRVKLVQSKPIGISHAMNKGISLATGDYILHLHSDDSLFYDIALQEVNEILSKNNYDWIYGKINVINDGKISIGLWPEKKIFHQNNKSILGRNILKYFNYIPHQSVFLKREVFDNFGLTNF